MSWHPPTHLVINMIGWTKLWCFSLCSFSFFHNQCPGMTFSPFTYIYIYIPPQSLLMTQFSFSDISNFVFIKPFTISYFRQDVSPFWNSPISAFCSYPEQNRLFSLTKFLFLSDVLDLFLDFPQFLETFHRSYILLILHLPDCPNKPQYRHLGGFNMYS